MELVTLKHDKTAVLLEYAKRNNRWYETAIDGNGKRFDSIRVMSWDLAGKLNHHIENGWMPID